MAAAKDSPGNIRALTARFADALPPGLIPGDASWREKLPLYLERLAAYNRAFNLVGPNGVQAILDSLVMDSFYLASLLGRLPLPGAPLGLDCGAGAGLPGIPLRMLWHAGDYLLVERRRKRALFMENVLAELDLPGTRVFCGDAFALREPASLVISRAWLPMPKALDYCASRLVQGGFAILFSRGQEPPPHPDFEKFMDLEYASGPGKIWALRHAGRL